MTANLLDAFNRLVAIQEAAVANSDAFPAGLVTQEAFPYWTNHYAGSTVTQNSQEFYVYTHRIDMALHLGTVTQDWLTQMEQNLWTQIATILDYFAARIRLQSATYTSPMVDIDPRGAIITGVSAYQPIIVGGIPTQTVGIVFSIEIPLEVQVAQAY